MPAGPTGRSRPGNVLDEAIHGAIGSGDPDRIRRHVVPRHPVRVLLDAASDAALLVVRGGGNGSAGTPLSPLCQDLVSRAPCLSSSSAAPLTSSRPSESPTASEPPSPGQSGDPQPAIEFRASRSPSPQHLIPERPP